MQQSHPLKHQLLGWHHPLVQFGLISCIIIGLLIASHFVLRPFSPRAITNDLYSIKFLEPEGYIKRYQLQGDQLKCSRSADGLIRTCTTVIEGRPLIVMTENTPRMQLAPVNCSLTYDDVQYDCKGGWDYENSAPSVFVRDDLGISAETFQKLRRENPLLYISESAWSRGASMVAVTAGLISVVFVFGRFRKRSLVYFQPAPLLMATLTTLLVAWGLSMAIGLLWDSVQVPLFVMPLAFLTGYWCWKLLRRLPASVRLSDRIIASGSVGVATYSLLYFLLIVNLLILGFVD